MSFLGILLTILLLSILVLVHELGHFIAARMMGIRVLEFALFMGPKIFSVKKGETVYSIRCIPLGGFCSMEGEETTSDDDKAYSNKPWYKKAFVLISGPAMNIILAFILTIIFFATNGYYSMTIGEVLPGSEADKLGISVNDKVVKINDMGVSSYIELGTYETMYASKEGFIYTVRKANGEKVDLNASSLGVTGIRYKTYIPGNVEEKGLFFSYIKDDSLAQSKGIEVGDKVVSVNGNEIVSRTSYDFYAKQYPLNIKVEKKSGEYVELTLPDEDTKMGVNLISIEDDEMNNGVFTMLGDSVEFSYSLIKVTLKSLVWIFTGKASANDVTGAAGLAAIVNDTVSNAANFTAGLLNFMILTILISINLGVFNILPFPALDGGRLVFAVIEGIRGKRIKPEHEGVVSLIGFVILIGLSILIFINDIIKLFK